MEKIDIAVVGHVTELYGPVQALKNYLIRKRKNFAFISVPFAYCTIERACFEQYSAGRCVVRENGPRNPTFKKLYAFYYIRSALFTMFQIMRMSGGVKIYVGIDNLNAFIGLVLKRLGCVDKVVYYVIDYTKKRFLLGFFNYVYHAIDRICVKKADYVWNISSRIAAVRKSQQIPDARNLVVPVGIEPGQLEKRSQQSGDRKILVVVSHLTESKGIQLVISAISEVSRIFPEIKLQVIGTGPYEDHLKRMVKDLGVEKSVLFLGAMNHDDLFKYLPQCGIALATYTESPDSITYYADPTKPKEYLACGLPVIITRVPWIADIIHDKPMGIAINYNIDELKHAVIKLMRDQSFYDVCRENARAYASGLSWDATYDNAFARLGV